MPNSVIGPSVEVLVLNKAEIEQLLTRREVIEATELAFRSEGEEQLLQPQKEPMYIDPPQRRNFIIAMPACLKNINVAGIKWACLYWDQEPGVPATWGDILILNHPQNGLPFAIMDATAITNMRTAGGHAVVAAKYLAKKNAKVLAIIGCGAEAYTGLPAFNDVFPLESIKIYDINPMAMTAFKETMSKQVLAAIEPCTSSEEAVSNADIVLMVTSAQEPVVFESWLPEGCFVAGLYSFCDLDPLLSKMADKWVIGSRASDGHLIVDNASGLVKNFELSWNDVYADMGEIVTGSKPGRENDKERIVYTHLGMGAHDIAVGKIAYDKAKKSDIGSTVKLI